MNALTQTNSPTGHCVATTRSYINDAMSLGHSSVELVSGAVQDIASRGNYISEPCISFATESLRSPVSRLVHPFTTARSLAGALENSMSRALEVLGDGLSHRFDKAPVLPAPAAALKRLVSVKPEAIEQPDSELVRREEQAYAEAINSTIDRALSTDHSKVAADKGDHDDLNKLPQVGPAMVRRLHGAGIYTFRQIASPDATDMAQLKQFSKLKSYSKWVDDAKRRTAED